MFPKQIHIYALHLNRTVQQVERLQKDRSSLETKVSVNSQEHIYYTVGSLFAQEEALAGKQWPDESPGWALLMDITDTIILFTQFFSPLLMNTTLTCSYSPLLSSLLLLQCLNMLWFYLYMPSLCHSIPVYPLTSVTIYSPSQCSYSSSETRD